MALSKGRGIIDIPSNHSVDQTVEKLKGILQAKGITLFTIIDHSGEAEKVGMKMPPTKLLIFGNPKVGTPVMMAAPRSATDLPLKILIWEDAQERFGSLTTAQPICRSDMACRRNCCKTSVWSKHWRETLRNSHSI